MVIQTATVVASVSFWSPLLHILPFRPPFTPDARGATWTCYPYRFQTFGGFLECKFHWLSFFQTAEAFHVQLALVDKDIDGRVQRGSVPAGHGEKTESHPDVEPFALTGPERDGSLRGVPEILVRASPGSCGEGERRRRGNENPVF